MPALPLALSKCYAFHSFSQPCSAAGETEVPRGDRACSGRTGRLCPDLDWNLRILGSKVTWWHHGPRRAAVHGWETDGPWGLSVWARKTQNWDFFSQSHIWRLAVSRGTCLLVSHPAGHHLCPVPEATRCFPGSSWLPLFPILPTHGLIPRQPEGALPGVLGWAFLQASSGHTGELRAPARPSLLCSRSTLVCAASVQCTVLAPASLPCYACEVLEQWAGLCPLPASPGQALSPRFPSSSSVSPLGPGRGLQSLLRCLGQLLATFTFPEDQ